MKINWMWLLLSIGVVFLGIGVFLIGYSVFKIYTKIDKESYYKDPFWVECRDYYIEINPNFDLKYVKVWFDNTTVCYYNDLKKGFSRVCDATKYVNRTKTFVVSSDRGENLVTCYSVKD